VLDVHELRGRVPSGVPLPRRSVEEVDGFGELVGVGVFLEADERVLPLIRALANLCDRILGRLLGQKWLQLLESG
jgi:hypothetical protein